MQNEWFGGQASSIKGECNCPDGMYWSDDYVYCENYWNAGMIAGVVIACIVGLCFIYKLYPYVKNCVTAKKAQNDAGNENL